MKELDEKRVSRQIFPVLDHKYLRTSTLGACKGSVKGHKTFEYFTLYSV